MILKRHNVLVRILEWVGRRARDGADTDAVKDGVPETRGAGTEGKIIRRLVHGKGAGLLSRMWLL